MAYVERSPGTTIIPVTPDNFNQAESDLMFAEMVKDGGFGRFIHHREPPPLDCPAVRPNRDTLYSVAVFDLAAGPLKVKDVPVDAFWSISVHDARGHFRKNDRGAYSLNNLTAVKDPDRSVSVQFGGCDAGCPPNCLPITPGWNYLVRLYRPRREILEGRWTFPVASPMQ